MRWIGRFVAALGLVVLAAVLAIRIVLGGGQRLPDRTTDPILPASALETVVHLDYPPGNIAVSKTGRIFFTLHPDGNPPHKVLELVKNRPVPFPNEAYQVANGDAPYFDTILSIRIDRQNRLWTLDFARFGRGQPRLLAFDVDTKRLVHRYDFPRDVAGLFSMLNDMQVDPKGKKIYIAETSPILQKPALIVYDTETRTSRRLLEGHPSVASRDYVIQAPGRDMVVFGIATLRIAVDSIALDTRGEWLYYGPVTGDRLFRIRTRDLNDASLTPQELARKVEDFAAKTLSDGLTMDVEDNVYLSDMEHSAILSLGPDRKLTTLVKDARLRWPDGFSFGPNGWLYVTCSSLQHVLFTSSRERQANAPYQIFRFKPGPNGVPGH